jgi:hypothetical protein
MTVTYIVENANAQLGFESFLDVLDELLWNAGLKSSYAHRLGPNKIEVRCVPLGTQSDNLTAIVAAAEDRTRPTESEAA